MLYTYWTPLIVLRDWIILQFVEEYFGQIQDAIATNLITFYFVSFFYALRPLPYLVLPSSSPVPDASHMAAIGMNRWSPMILLWVLPYRSWTSFFTLLRYACILLCQTVFHLCSSGVAKGRGLGGLKPPPLALRKFFYVHCKTMNNHLMNNHLNMLPKYTEFDLIVSSPKPAKGNPRSCHKFLVTPLLCSKCSSHYYALHCLLLSSAFRSEDWLRNRHRYLEIYSAPTGAKSREPAFSQPPSLMNPFGPFLL